MGYKIPEDHHGPTPQSLKEAMDRVPTHNPRTDPAEILREAADVYEAKSREYGNNYRKIGPVLATMFDGVSPRIETPEDWERVHFVVMSAMKLTRYVENFNRGGHEDSTMDEVVYGAMRLGADREEGGK